MSYIDFFAKKISRYRSSKFVGDGIWLLIAQGVVATSGILLNILIGNYEGSEFLGVFNQVLAYYMLIGVLSRVGLNNALIKRVSEDSHDLEKQKVHFNTTLLFVFVFSLFITLTLYLIISFFPFVFSSYEVAEGLAIIIFTLSIYNLNKIIMAKLNGIRSQKQYAISRIIRWAGLIVMIAYIAMNNLTHSYYYYSVLAVEIVLLAYLYMKQKDYFSFSFSSKILKKNLVFGFQSYISELLSTSKQKLDIIIAGYFLTKNEMGIFTFIYSIAAGFMILPSVLSVNINPIISNLWYKDKKGELITKLKQVFYNLSASLVPFLILFLLGYYLILPVLTEIDIISNHNIFLLMMSGSLVFATVSWLGGFLIMTDHLVMNIYRTLLILLFGVLTMLLCSYLFGLKGVAYAIMLSALFNAIMIISFVRKVIITK